MTPRLLWTDAYSISSGHRFESDDANAFSKYYLTFRKGPYEFDGANFTDNRICFAGLQQLINKLLTNPITDQEINETIKFLENRKATTKGLRHFDFDINMWQRVIKEFNGMPPIVIDALPEGGTAYPNEPVIRVWSPHKGFGPLCAYWEAIIISYIWSASTRLTFARHWLKYNRDLISSIEHDLPIEQINFLASISAHCFGARAAMCLEEMEHVGLQHLYCFLGTDTFAASYQAWKNGSLPGTGTSIDALAHRIVQGFENEKDAYNLIYDIAQDGDLVSEVCDCYGYKYAFEKYLVPLALKSKETKNGKITIARPDSGNPLEQILWSCDIAEKHGLVETKSNGYKYMTTLRLIEGDGMTFKKIEEINDALIAKGFAPHGVLVFGIGGFLRNSITRDTFSTKYALCQVGEKNRPVIKFSEDQGKRTLPMVKVLRSPEALASGQTIVHPDEDGVDALINYYDCGHFGPGMRCRFPDIQKRVLEDFEVMPSFAGQMSPMVKEVCDKLAEQYIIKL